MDATSAGRTARSLEPLHALCYFAPEVDTEVAALGVRPGRTTYFASRAAAMGAVGPGPVAATFYVFDPTLVAHLLPAAWAAADPADVVAARWRGVDAAYRRLLGDAVEDPRLPEVVDLLRRASDAGEPGGRALYAAHADLAWPETPHLAVWHGLTLLREHRGDGHVAALLDAGLGGVEALVSHTATGTGFTQPAAQASRGWSDEQWAAAAAGLADRGLMTPEGGLTEAGAALRTRVEDRTDELGRATWAAIGEDGAARVREVLRPLVKQALVAGAFPAGVFAAF